MAANPAHALTIDLLDGSWQRFYDNIGAELGWHLTSDSLTTDHYDPPSSNPGTSTAFFNYESTATEFGSISLDWEIHTDISNGLRFAAAIQVGSNTSNLFNGELSANDTISGHFESNVLTGELIRFSVRSFQEDPFYFVESRFFNIQGGPAIPEPGTILLIGLG